MATSGSYCHPGSPSDVKDYKSIQHPGFPFSPHSRFPKLTAQEYQDEKQLLKAKSRWSNIRQTIMSDGEYALFEQENAIAENEKAKMNVTPSRGRHNFIRFNVSPLDDVPSQSANKSDRSVYFQDTSPQLSTPSRRSRRRISAQTTPVTTDPAVTKILETLVAKSTEPRPAFQIRPQLRDFQKFQGNMSENINSFLTKFESIAEMQNLTETVKLQTLAVCLVDAAEGVLDQDITEGITYQGAKTKLRSLYDTKQKQDAIVRQFDNLKLNTGDNVLNFLRRFNLLIKESRNQMTNQAKLEKLKASIKGHQALYDFIFLTKDTEDFSTACNHMMTFVGHKETEDVFAEPGKYTLANSSSKVAAICENHHRQRH